MSPRRQDYRSRKEYRWAKKVEQRESLSRIILSGRRMKSSTMIGFIAWVATVLVIAAILPAHADGALTAVAFFVSIVVAVLFTRSKLGRMWAVAWDNYVTRSVRKSVERGDTDLLGRWSAKVFAEEQAQQGAAPAKHGTTTSTAPSPRQPHLGSGIAGEIDKLAKLKASGAITEDEFKRAKARLLTSH